MVDTEKTQLFANSPLLPTTEFVSCRRERWGKRFFKVFCRSTMAFLLLLVCHALFLHDTSTPGADFHSQQPKIYEDSRRTLTSKEREELFLHVYTPQMDDLLDLTYYIKFYTKRRERAGCI